MWFWKTERRLAKTVRSVISPTWAGRHTTSETCQSHEFSNLFIVDGATFPFLPAKNITFSLMANAVRVASRAF